MVPIKVRRHIDDTNVTCNGNNLTYDSTYHYIIWYYNYLFIYLNLIGIITVNPFVVWLCDTLPTHCLTSVTLPT
jgi:hypothetical protein